MNAKKKILLTSYEVMVLETLLEGHIEDLESMSVSCDREKELLRKIYSISSTEYKKFEFDKN